MNGIDQLQEQSNMEDAAAYANRMEDQLLDNYNQKVQQMPFEAQMAMIDAQVKDAENLQAFGEVLERLHDNKDFQKVFDEKLFKEESHRLVLLRANLHDAKPQQEKIDRLISMIGELYKWLQSQRVIAEGAEVTLKNADMQRSALISMNEQENAGEEGANQDHLTDPLDEGIG